MRLNTFILTLCACALHARAASISAGKKIDDLDNVDLDNIVVEPELIDRITVKDTDNNLRKAGDIPVKVIEEPVVDENSNDYIPKEDDNIIIKRVEVDLNNPGPPQRQEHETQNPENYGEKEKALFSIQKTIDDTEKVFKQGLHEVSNSFKTLFGKDEDLPAIQQNIQNLRLKFTDQFEKLGMEIKTQLKPTSNQTKKAADENLVIVESRLENVKKSFKNGVDILTEGIEVLSILKEEDEAANVKSLLNEGLAKEDVATDVKPPPDNTGSSTQAPSTTTISTNPIFQYFASFQTSVMNAMTGLNQAVQNTFNGQQNNNAFTNFFGGPGQNTGNQNPQEQPAKPVDAQSDTGAAVPTSATTAAPTSEPWGPQAFIQGVQNTWQNIFNPGQNQQNTQQQPQQNVQQPATNRPFLQAVQNMFQFIQRPDQTVAPQQPVNPTPKPEKVPEQPSVAAEKPENAVPVQSDPIPAASAGQTQSAQSAPQTAAINQPQPIQNGPIQQLIQNNPIIKGIQSAVQRIQGTPNPETPRNEIIKNENEENAEIKGHGGNNANQGNSDINRVKEKIEEQSEEIINPIKEKEIVEAIKAEETMIPSISDKTE